MAKRGKINKRFGMTEAKFWGMIRATLRQKWSYSHARKQALLNARIPHKGKGRRKWAVVCCQCRGEYGLGEKIEIRGKNGRLRHVSAYNVDHIVDAGSLKSFKDLGSFADRLFCDSSGLQVLCRACHNMKTHR